MIQVSVYSNDILTNQGSFSSQEEAEAWVAYHQFSGDVRIEEVSAKLAQEQINAEALTFLASTDYLIIREMDNGVPCPADIKAKRQAARESIVK